MNFVLVLIDRYWSPRSIHTKMSTIGLGITKLWRHKTGRTWKLVIFRENRRKFISMAPHIFLADFECFTCVWEHSNLPKWIASANRPKKIGSPNTPKRIGSPNRPKSIGLQTDLRELGLQTDLWGSGLQTEEDCISKQDLRGLGLQTDYKRIESPNRPKRIASPNRPKRIASPNRPQ